MTWESVDQWGALISLAWMLLASPLVKFSETISSQGLCNVTSSMPATCFPKTDLKMLSSKKTPGGEMLDKSVGRKMLDKRFEPNFNSCQVHMIYVHETLSLRLWEVAWLFKLLVALKTSPSERSTPVWNEANDPVERVIPLLLLLNCSRTEYLPSCPHSKSKSKVMAKGKVMSLALLETGGA